MVSNGFIFLFLLIFLVFPLVPVIESVKCYCTDDHCVPYGSCEGTVCMVGILRDTNQVIRTCGNSNLGCHRNEDDKWTDLCACDQPFCNTFAYLRSHTRRTPASPSPPHAPQFQSPTSHSPMRLYDSSSRQDSHPDMNEQMQAQHHDAPLVFHRMDRPDDGTPLQTYTGVSEQSANKTSLLTLLLVVVPLTVGAATIMVVALNYYCHLC